MGNPHNLTYSRVRYASALNFLSDRKGMIQREIGISIGQTRQHVANFISGRGGAYTPALYDKLKEMYSEQIEEYEQDIDLYELEWQVKINPEWGAQQLIKYKEQVDDLEGDLARMQRRLEHEQEQTSKLTEMLKATISKAKEGGIDG